MTDRELVKMEQKELTQKKIAYDMVFSMLRLFCKEGTVHNTPNYFRRYIECVLLGYTFRITLTIKRED